MTISHQRSVLRIEGSEKGIHTTLGDKTGNEM